MMRTTREETDDRPLGETTFVGTNMVQDRRQNAALHSDAAITLRQVWNDYQLTRKLKPITVRNYNQRLTQYLGDWLELPINEITKDMVEDRHRSIKGRAMANSTFRTLRALLIYAGYRYETADGSPVLKTNPVHRLSELRAWNKDRRRQSVIHAKDLGRWFKAVFTIQERTVRDVMLVAIFTGMRKNEILTLKWQDVDLKNGFINLLNTKNGRDCKVPMSDYVHNLLLIRRQNTAGEFVFPGRRKSQPLKSVDKACGYVTEISGVKFSLHDCRRTMATIADELDIKTEVIKALLNHVSDDVTEGYTIRSVDRLRKVTQSVTDRILQHAGMLKPRLDALAAQDQILMRQQSIPDPAASLESAVLAVMVATPGRLIDVPTIAARLSERQRVHQRKINEVISRLADNGWLEQVRGSDGEMYQLSPKFVALRG